VVLHPGGHQRARPNMWSTLILLPCVISAVESGTHLRLYDVTAVRVRHLKTVVKHSLFSCGVACEALPDCTLWTMDALRPLCKLYSSMYQAVSYSKSESESLHPDVRQVVYQLVSYCLHLKYHKIVYTFPHYILVNTIKVLIVQLLQVYN